MADEKKSVWARALAAPDFLKATDEDDAEPIINRMLVSGSMTLIVAPRGLGKTHVAAHARGGLFLSQQLAKLRVAYIDRDNPRRELRRRGTRWGWSGAGEYLRVLTRMDAPPLTDRAWLMFPFADYDVVIIDSVSSSTEGVDESSGGDSGAALAPLLEFSIRPGGRQVTALGRKDHGTPFL